MILKKRTTYLHNISCMRTVVICIITVIMGFDYNQPSLKRIFVAAKRIEDIKSSCYFHAFFNFFGMKFYKYLIELQVSHKYTHILCTHQDARVASFPSFLRA